MWLLALMFFPIIRIHPCKWPKQMDLPDLMLALQYYEANTALLISEIDYQSFVSYGNLGNPAEFILCIVHAACFHMDASIPDLFSKSLVPPTYSVFTFDFPTFISNKACLKMIWVFENSLCLSNFRIHMQFWIHVLKQNICGFNMTYFIFIYDFSLLIVFPRQVTKSNISNSQSRSLKF